MSTEPKTLAQEMTGFLSDPSEVLNAAAADPKWATEPLEALERALVAKGFSPEARAEIIEGAKRMDAMGTELLSALGIG